MMDEKRVKYVMDAYAKSKKTTYFLQLFILLSPPSAPPPPPDSTTFMGFDRLMGKLAGVARKNIVASIVWSFVEYNASILPHPSPPIDHLS